MTKLNLLAFCWFVSSTIGASFTTKGSKVYDPNGNWVVFRGIGLTCTEYMMKLDMDSLNPYNGYWAYNSCFGGPSSDGGPIELNSEPQNVLNYLTGSNFNTNPTINKVQFDSPYDQVMDTDTPQLHPIIRIPFTGSCYMYDEDVDTGNHQDYVDTLDLIVEFFTNNSVAVVLDLHWNCPDDTAISGCTGAQGASMALLNYGSNPGSVQLWSTVSSKYADNPYVFYELFNEPWIQKFDPWYAGDSTYAGMKDMYEAIRKNDPNGIVIIGGANQYALDAQTPIAMYLQYQQDTGSSLTNVIWNSHPYQGAGQGLEHSLNSEMRFSLAMKLTGPVIYTEFGQYCCSSSDNSPCTGTGQCSNHNTGDNFVFNILNMATQYDISTIGWGWRGNNDDYPCGSKPDCDQPDMRSENGTLVDGSYSGADWETVWNTFVSASTINVMDATSGKPLSKDDYQDVGFLPRPCIVGEFNLGDICGYDLNTDIDSISVSDLTGQSIYDSILPGIPPKGDCTAQGCNGYQCQTYTGPCQQT